MTSRGENNNNNNNNNEKRFALFPILEEKYPQQKKLIQTTETTINKIISFFINTALPFYEDYILPFAENVLYKKFWLQLNGKAYFPILLSLLLLFFGGYFLTTITVMETLRLLCWDDIKENYLIIKKNYEKAKEENEKDNLKDDDGNGIADVLEINDRSLLLFRKIKLFMTSINQEELKQSFKILMNAFFSVVATLKVKTAHTFTLSASIAEVIEKNISLQDLLTNINTAERKKKDGDANHNNKKDLIPEEWIRLAPFAQKILIQSITFFFAHKFSAAVTTFHCCLRGAYLLVQYLLQVGKEKHFVEDSITLKDTKTKVLLTVVTLVGFSFQLSHYNFNEDLIFPLRIILAPFALLEWLLTWVVSVLLAVPTNAAAGETK